MTYQKILVLLLAVGWMVACGDLRPRPADLVIRGGTVITLETDMPAAEAIAIRNGSIVYVGTNQGVQQWIDPETRVLNANGAVVLPGLVDAHCHLLGLGMYLTNVNLVGTSSYKEVIERVKARAMTTPKGQWILGRGWDQNDWEPPAFPTHDALSAAVPDHPVWITRIDGHAGLANAMAMQRAGVTAATEDPEGGRVLRDSAGNPTGVFVDNGEALITSAIPELTSRQRQALLERAAQACLTAGLTGVHDMGIPPEQIYDYKALIDADRLGLRVYALINPPDHITGAATYFRQHRVDGYGNGMFTLRGVKLYMDGALGSRGAALLADYADDPGNRGLLVTRPETILAICRAALDAGFQVCTHAIGDRGNHLVLNAYEQALKSREATAARFRVEHAQVLSPEDIPRFAQLDVIPSMQPTHATSDMVWAEDRLGPIRIKGAYAWRSLLNTGVFIPCGSDFPIESYNPMLGIYAAVSRRDRDGRPQGGWTPQQRMTREEALKGFTLWAAKASFQENDLGTIRVGKRADLTIVDRNPLNCDVADIPGTRVLWTIVGGRIRFQANHAER